MQESDVYEPKTVGELQALAAKRGCDLLVADDRTLLCDLDSGAAERQFLWMNKEWRDTGGDIARPLDAQILRSRRGRGHGIVKMDRPLSLRDRITLQAILGSDPLREFLLLMELGWKGDTVNCLFRPRTGAERGD